MKKVLVVLVMFCAMVLTSCTDNSEENLAKENETQKLQSTTPGNDGTIGGDDEEEETGGE